MLKLYESTPGTAVLSLRTGGPVATILAPIINPNNLYIEGWFVEDSISKQQLVLLSTDIRDVIPQGFAIDDHEVLTELDDLIRIKEVLKYKFELLNLRVTSESGHRYGKISDYAYDTGNMFIQKFYVAQSLVKNFGSGTLSVDRSQIIEVTTRRMTIEDPTESSRTRATLPSVI